MVPRGASWCLIHPFLFTLSRFPYPPSLPPLSVPGRPSVLGPRVAGSSATLQRKMSGVLPSAVSVSYLPVCCCILPVWSKKPIDQRLLNTGRSGFPGGLVFVSDNCRRGSSVSCVGPEMLAEQTFCGNGIGCRCDLWVSFEWPSRLTISFEITKVVQAQLGQQKLGAHVKRNCLIFQSHEDQSKCISAKDHLFVVSITALSVSVLSVIVILCNVIAVSETDNTWSLAETVQYNSTFMNLWPTTHILVSNLAMSCTHPTNELTLILNFSSLLFSIKNIIYVPNQTASSIYT